MTFASRLLLLSATLAASPAAAQDRHYYVCSGLASAQRTFFVSAVFAAPPGQAAALKAAFARYVLTLNYRLDEATLECLGDASLSLATTRLIRARESNMLYRVAEVSFTP
jgi:N-formylglutamate amidohydrolase